MERYIISMTGNELAKQLIADLGNGAATSDGDRASSYYELARDERNGLCVIASLIEFVSDLNAGPYYGLHIIDDISEEFCEFRYTKTLSKGELAALLDEILEKFQTLDMKAMQEQSLIFWANYEYENRPLCFVRLEDKLPAEAIVRILRLFDLWYGSTDQETTDWALEFQLLARMLLSDNALLVNFKYLELPDECLDELTNILSDVDSELGNQYRRAFAMTQEQIDSLYLKER